MNSPSVTMGHSSGTRSPNGRSPALRSPMIRSLRSPMLESPMIRADDWVDRQVTADPMDVLQIIQESEVQKFRLGLILIFVAIVTWMIGLELVNAVLKDNAYLKPILFSYITGSCFVLNFIPDLWPKKKPTSEQSSEQSSAKEIVGDEPVPLTTREVLILSFQVAIIYFLYNGAVLSCLKYTLASTQTVIGSTTSIFTLIIGWYLGTDSFTTNKVVCTIASFLGIVLVNVSESRSKASDNDNKFIPKNPKLGNSLALFAALMYAFYLIIMKVKCGTGNKTTNERRLFGFVGLNTILLGIPVLFAADYYGIEEFEFPPPNNMILILIFINGIFSYISDFTTILASLLTSPLITSLSLTSSVPITIFIDYLVIFLTGGKSPDKSTSGRFIYFSGIVSILVSVILINLNSSNESEMIEEIIEDTLSESIRQDEVLSPILSPMLTARPRFSSPLVPLRREHRSIPNFNLEGEALVNSNHSQLYTIENELEDGKVVVYGGNNHIYHVKHLDEA